MSRGGARPGAGRKCLTDEEKKARAVDHCWDHVNRKMENPKTPDEEKTKISLVICPKTIPQNIKADVKNQVDGELIIKWMD
jgi:hypothetical protein